MKRDLDLIRTILLVTEEKQKPDQHFEVEKEIPDHSQDEVMYHVGLLYQGHLVQAMAAHSSSGDYWIITGLTPAGHDFLDNTRDPSVWKKVKAKFAEVGGAVSMDVLKAAALKLTLAHFGLG